MIDMSDIYLRPQLATDLARKLLRPTYLDTRLRSGIFLPGESRTGKTSFLQHDLIPALQKVGAVVIYVDIMSNSEVSPYHLVCDAIKKTLAHLKPYSPVLNRFRRFLGLKYSFKLETIGQDDGVTLAEALTAIVDQARADVVLIIDEVQWTITADEEQLLLNALKAARDAINLREETPGYFVFIGSGSPPALVNELRGRNNHAFYGVASIAYPVLEQDYVEFLLKSLAQEGYAHLPSLEVATEAFKTLGSRPETMLKALRQLLKDGAPSANPDADFLAIANDLRSPTATNV